MSKRTEENLSVYKYISENVDWDCGVIAFTLIGNKYDRNIDCYMIMFFYCMARKMGFVHQGDWGYQHPSRMCSDPLQQ